MKTKVIIITGSELRHTYFRKYVALCPFIDVLASFCESSDGGLNDRVRKSDSNKTLRIKHLQLREQSEKDFFGLFCNFVDDNSNPIFIKKGDINNEEYVDVLSSANPDLIISYGSSIIKSHLIDLYENRFINIHLGLSPYYRGSGTNYWPFVNDELQFIGVTFMQIDSGIDTGEIIHQYRARMYEDDTLHQVGNRLILDMAEICSWIIVNFKDLNMTNVINYPDYKERYYRNKDFSEESLFVMKNNLKAGMIQKYLSVKDIVDKQYPIFSQDVITEN